MSSGDPYRAKSDRENKDASDCKYIGGRRLTLQVSTCCLAHHGLARTRLLIHSLGHGSPYHSRPALSLSAARHAVYLGIYVNGLGYWTGNGHLCVRLSVYGLLLLCDTTNTRRRRLPGFMLESSRYRLPSKLFWLILFFSHRLLLPLLPNLLLPRVDVICFVYNTQSGRPGGTCGPA